MLPAVTIPEVPFLSSASNARKRYKSIAMKTSPALRANRIGML